MAINNYAYVSSLDTVNALIFLICTIEDLDDSYHLFMSWPSEFCSISYSSMEKLIEKTLYYIYYFVNLLTISWGFSESI